MVPNVPPAFSDLAPDLLVHSYWKNIPKPDPAWYRAQIGKIELAFDTQPWRTWSAQEWLIALSLVSIGIAVVHQCVNLGQEVARVRRLHRNA